MRHFWREKAPQIIILAVGAIALSAPILTQFAHQYRNSQQPESHAAESVQEQRPERALNGTPDQPSAKQEQRERLKPADWVAIAGLAVSFAALLLLLRTFYLQRLATIGDQRAYMRSEMLEMNVGIDEPLTVTHQPINYGKTPAFDVTVMGNLFVQPATWSWDSFDPKPFDAETAFILHPQEEHKVITSLRTPDRKTILLAAHVLHGIATGESKLFLRVLIRYRDVFRKWRETEKRMELTGEENLKTGTWEVSKSGNRAT